MTFCSLFYMTGESTRVVGERNKIRVRREHWKKLTACLILI